MIIGITGGIGTGKSTFAKALEALGAFRVDADAIGHRILDENTEMQEQIVQHFGEGVLKNGCIERRLLADVVFSTNEALARYNAIIQPILKKRIQDEIASHGDYGCIVLDMAILIESDLHDDCDCVVLITAPLQMRFQRIRAVKQWSDQQIRDCMDRQLSDEQRRKQAHQIIHNAGSLNELADAARTFWREICKDVQAS